MLGTSRETWDRPRAPRRRLCCPVEIALGETRFPGLARDANRNGMLLHVEVEHAGQLSIGQRLNIACTPAPELGPIRFDAEVVWLGPATSSRGDEVIAVGVQHLSPGPEVVRTLDALLARRDTEVLLSGFTEELAPLVASTGLIVSRSDDPEEILRILGEREVAVLALGPGLPAAKACELLTRAAEELPELDTVSLVFAGGSDLIIFQDLVSTDRLFFLSREPLPAGECASVVHSAIRHHRGLTAAGEGLFEQHVATEHLQQIFAVTQQLGAQQDLAAAGQITARAAEKLLGADRAYCLFHEPKGDTLWAQDTPHDPERRESAAVGLCSFVARTGEPLRVTRVADDPRYDKGVDDPQGRGDEQLLAAPVSEPSGEVLAVLCAVRGRAAPPFTAEAAESLALLASRAAPPLGRMVLQRRLREEEARGAQILRGDSPDLFREEALQHQRMEQGGYGTVLQLSRGWIRSSFWLLLVVVAGALGFVCLSRVHEYAEGPAVVRVEGRTHLTALAAGTVTSVEAQPGQRVAAGQVLLRFHDGAEVAELGRIQREFELQLVNRLRDPADPAARQALISLYAQRKLAEARLAERTVRTPHDSLVGDVRVRPGQHVSPGEVLLALAGARAEVSLIALLPGHYRPQLRPGMPLRLELAGYERTYRTLSVKTIGDEVIGIQEAKRYLGPEKAETLTSSGPVVLVRALLGSPTFVAQGRTYGYHDGMVGVARVRARSSSLLLTLIPGLRALTEGGDGH